MSTYTQNVPQIANYGTGQGNSCAHIVLTPEEAQHLHAVLGSLMHS